MQHKLVYDHGRDKFLGALTHRTYSTFAAAQERETSFYSLATRLLGRELDPKEVHRRQTADHEQVPRRDWPQELRYAGFKTSTPSDAPDRESAIDFTIRRIKKRVEESNMSFREKMAADQIAKLEAEKAEIQRKRRAAADLDAIKASKEWKQRADELDRFRVIAAFSPASPDYELVAVKEMETALHQDGDLPKYDKFATPFVGRLRSRSMEQRASLNKALQPRMAAVDAVEDVLAHALKVGG